ncbi:flagellar basal body rod protein FlgC [Govanella unica]|uniref:Flagellar basal-body rod protein FlgC n=1 Tax=Govanella unica TaxID=2975056 RepID=A0A9X3Z6M3_9PROT|nr:flagellar basal body rod protein FlgC [Govania unica]MDA5193232.1 flagellar basal body rod protein FlgC [Govania unica]
MDLSKAMMISASGMKAQSVRMRVISENLANSDSLPNTAGTDPYRRKVVSFADVLNRKDGIHEVKVTNVGVDKSDFGKRYQPGHPAADGDGYVQTPNVNSLMEVMDMKQAQRSYEANINAVETSRAMISRTIELLR